MKSYELYLDTLQILKQNKEHYLLLEPDSENAKLEEQWLGMHFPFDWGRVQWGDVPNSRCYKFKDNIEAGHIIKEFCKDFPSQDQIAIFWFDASFPTLIMDLEIALKYVSSLVEEDTNMWFLNKARKWCLEVYHEGEVCMGYSTVQD